MFIVFKFFHIGEDMLKQETLDNFYKEKRFALIGFSRDPKKFSRLIYKELSPLGYEIIPVNPHSENIDGIECYQKIGDLPKDLTRAVITTPKSETASVVKELIANGFDNIWIQQGASTDEVTNELQNTNINYINNECIFMYSEPVKSIHKFHRFLWKLFGKGPK